MPFKILQKLPTCVLFPVFALLLACLFSSCDNNKSGKQNRKVYIRNTEGKYTLYRNGKPFDIKGAAGFTNLEKLYEIGGNSIRTWDTLNLASILDEAEKNKLAVIVGLPLPNSKFIDFVYNDPAKVSKDLDDYTKIINRFKNHPALLMWCVGNELEFNYKPKYYNFYKAFNQIVKMIHRDDPDHPVTTTMVNLEKKNLFCIQTFTDIDIISINIFSSLRSLRNDLEKFSWFWDGPFLITEWGVEGPWLEEKNAWGAYIEETSTKKAQQYYDMYFKYIPKENPRLMGSFVFYWGNKQETTQTWFSMFNEQGMQTESVGMMQHIWTGKWPDNMAPKLNYMLVDNKGARDNIIFKPGGTANASLNMPEPGTTSGHTLWEIYPEDWYKKSNVKNTKKLMPVSGSIISSGYLNANFRIPLKEGPYRIFATVYDKYGNFATSNTPFYVVSNQ